MSITNIVLGDNQFGKAENHLVRSPRTATGTRSRT